MLVEHQEPPVSAPKWARMPGSVRLKLNQTIADHLRLHRSQFYDLLRDDPQFAPWIGTHLGARGEKRLDRAIADVRRVQKQKLARKAAVIAHPADEAAETVQLNPPDPVIADPAHRLAAAGSAVVSYDELQGDLRRRRRQLERAMDVCLDEDGEVADPGLFLKLSREHRATVTDSANLAKRFHADVHSEAFLERVLGRMLQGHDPEAARALIAELSNIFRETTGIAATGGGA
jgi:hypothetical protein